MHRSHQLLHLMSDGHFYSGESLGEHLGVSRSMVWKMIKTFEGLGLDVHAVAGKGYRLAAPLELLDEEKIKGILGSDSASLLSGLDIHFDIDSTNRYLMHKAMQDAPSGCACLAEMQSAGRGRRGRSWVSPFAGNIYLSLLWRFNSAPASLGSMGLVVGLAVVSALEETGVQGAGLKWPNDVLVDGKKLAGVLLEMAGDPAGLCHVVIGVGLNVQMPTSADCQIDQPWVDVSSLLGETVERNKLAGRLLHHLLVYMQAFELEGFAPFQAAWQQRDTMYQKRVSLHRVDGVEHGISCGVDARGALLLEQNGLVTPYLTGDVSLRLYDGAEL